jgi:hypothetical protein
VTHATPAPSTDFDPAAPVPEEYDLFCHECGYSLLGLSGDRCPECGRAYDPGELPYARVAWLHRRRIGRWTAYWRTVRHVVFRPTSFATEMCRPVRISADDAKRFRRATVYVAATTPLVVALLLGWLFGPGGVRWTWYDLALFVGQLAGGWVATVLFLRLATDMPLFIWQGLPSLPPTELAPLHQYAAAPLALTPVVVVAGVLTQFTSPWPVLSRAVIAAVAAGWLVACWTTPLVLMKAATGCGTRRVVLLGLYLPLHWLLMAAVVGMTALVVTLGLSFILDRH